MPVSAAAVALWAHSHAWASAWQKRRASAWRKRLPSFSGDALAQHYYRHRWDATSCSRRWCRHLQSRRHWVTYKRRCKKNILEDTMAFQGRVQQDVTVRRVSLRCPCSSSTERPCCLCFEHAHALTASIFRMLTGEGARAYSAAR